jgi:cell division transport system permease protein
MRLLRRALRGLARNAATHALTLVTVALTFLVVAALGLIYFNLERLIADWQSRFRMVVVLKPAVPAGRIPHLRRELEALPGVVGAEYIDRAAARDALAARLGEREGKSSQIRALGLLERNPLPASFRLRVVPEGQEPVALKSLAGRAAELPGVAEVRYGDVWAGRFHTFFRLFKVVATATSILLFLAATFIISSQIRLALALRRGEIELLRLLGASGGFIRAPYVIEGAILGTAGAAAAIALLAGLYGILVTQAGTDIEGLLSASRFLPPQAALALVGFGAAVGILGSLVSLRRLS